MYAYIRGIVSDMSADTVVLEAAGVGYELFAGRKTGKIIKRHRNCAQCLTKLRMINLPT